MYKIIALIGKAGSGKDTLLRKLIENNPSFNEIISCTSRPKREGEKEGINYYYLTEQEFKEKEKQGEMLETSYFNNWFYGTPCSSLDKDKINIGVFNPDGIKSMRSKSIEEGILYRIFYITTSSKMRLLRQLNREENPNVEEIIRRYNADEKDFKNLDFNYTVIENENYDDLIAGANSILEWVKTSV